MQRRRVWRSSRRRFCFVFVWFECFILLNTENTIDAVDEELIINAVIHFSNLFLFDFDEENEDEEFLRLIRGWLGNAGYGYGNFT